MRQAFIVLILSQIGLYLFVAVIAGSMNWLPEADPLFRFMFSVASVFVSAAVLITVGNKE